MSVEIWHFRSWPHAPGTHYHLTLDPAVLWTLSNDTSRPTCSDSLNLMPPAPLYLRTLRLYTNPILLLWSLFYLGATWPNVVSALKSSSTVGVTPLPTRRPATGANLTRGNSRKLPVGLLQKQNKACSFHLSYCMHCLYNSILPIFGVLRLKTLIGEGTYIHCTVTKVLIG